MSVVVTGRVVGRQVGSGVPELRIEAWASHPSLDEPLMAIDTDATGVWRMEFEEDHLL